MLLPPSTLLIGPAGTGKTTSVATLIAAGIHVRMIATEGGAPARVLHRLRELGLPNDPVWFDFHYVAPVTQGFASLRESAKIVNTTSLEGIAKMSTGIAKSNETQWLALLDSIEDFPSDRTGEHYGDATEWGPTHALVIDGLTGVSLMSRMLTVGFKPNPSPGEWGVMQGNIYNLLHKLTTDCKSFFIVIAHIEKEMNELTGIPILTVSTLGAKLAPKLPPMFTNVILAKREGTNFVWSTADVGVDTKNGDLPIEKDLAPDFAPIVATYRANVDDEDIVVTPTQPMAVNS